MRKGGGRIPFVPSPMDVVEKMLSLADPRSDELLIDLGSGDGRIIITGAERYRCNAIGVELNRRLVEESVRRILRKSLDKKVKIIHGDLYEADFSGANVITLYLLPSTLKALKPKLLSLKRGSRIICHDFPIPGLTPSEVARIKSLETGKIHSVYLYEIK